jgi:alpha-galactosidase
MRRYFLLLLLFVSTQTSFAQAPPRIVIETDHTSLVLTVGDKQRLYQTYLGQKLTQPADQAQLPAGRHEAYVPAGLE